MKLLDKILILEDQFEGFALLKNVAQQLQPQAIIERAESLAEFSTLSLEGVSLLLADLHLQDGISIDTIASTKLQWPELPVVVTTLYSDDELVFNALSAGADGYLLKSEGQERLSFFLARFLDGEPPISPRIARKLMAFFRADSKSEQTGIHLQQTTNQQNQQSTQFKTPTATLSPSTNVGADTGVQLTAREIDVLKLIATGKMTKQVAVILNISAHTVNDVIKSIYRKLGIHSRAEATLHATRHGII
jgi:DNA-binding NarL/FixJ family response regulator